MGTKESIDNIWERYTKTLKLLSNALDELDKKPKEVQKIMPETKIEKKRYDAAKARVEQRKKGLTK